MWRAVLRLKASPRQTFVPADRWAEHAEQLAGELDVYASIATFKDKRRTRNAIAHIDTFAVDIDVAHNSHYPTKKAAADAATAASRHLGIPPTRVVDSGGGIHLYWDIDTPLPLDEWQPMAKALKAKLDGAGLQADWGVTVDAARVMRVVGTVNSRTGTVCTLLHRTDPVPVDRLRRALRLVVTPGVTADASLAVPPAVLFPPVPVEDLARKCGVVRWHLDTAGAEATEPQWNLALAVAMGCTDPEKTAERLSSGHPGYDPEELAKRLAYKQAYRQGGGRDRPLGVPTCEALGEHHPDICAGCPLKGRVKTPFEAVAHEKREYEFAELGPPMYYEKDGAIWKRTDGTKDDVLVLHGTLGKLRLDAISTDEGPVPVMAGIYRAPTGRINPFALRLTEIATMATAAPALARVTFAIASGREVFELVSYLTRRLGAKASVGRVYTRVGHDEASDAFVLGDRCILPSGADMPIAYDGGLGAAVKLRGNADAAMTAFRRWFAIEPRAEARAFVAAAFAAPFYHLLSMDVPVLGLTHRDTGSGKTQTLAVAESVWFRPFSVRLDSATPKSLGEIFAAHRHLPVLWDEMRPTHNEVRTLFEYLQGRSRARLRRDGTLKTPQTYGTFLLGTSNRELRTLFANSAIGFTAAGLARVIEFRLPTLYEFIAAPDEYETTIACMGANSGQLGFVWMRAAWPQRDRLVERARQLGPTLLENPTPSDFAHFRILLRVGGLVMAVAERMEKQFQLVGMMDAVTSAFRRVIDLTRTTIRMSASNVDALIMQYVRQHGERLVVLNNGTVIAMQPSQTRPIAIELDIGPGLLVFEWDTLDQWASERGSSALDMTEYLSTVGRCRIDEAYPVGHRGDVSSSLVRALVIEIGSFPETHVFRRYLDRVRGYYAATTGSGLKVVEGGLGKGEA